MANLPTFWEDPVLDAAYQKMVALTPVKKQTYTNQQIGDWRTARLEYRTLLNNAGPFPKQAPTAPLFLAYLKEQTAKQA